MARQPTHTLRNLILSATAFDACHLRLIRQALRSSRLTAEERNAFLRYLESVQVGSNNLGTTADTLRVSRCARLLAQLGLQARLALSGLIRRRPMPFDRDVTDLAGQFEALSEYRSNATYAILELEASRTGYPWIAAKLRVARRIEQDAWSRASGQIRRGRTERKAAVPFAALSRT